MPDDDDDLFSNSKYYARRTDPQTSHDAANSFNIPHAEWLVFRAIRSRGDHGANWDEQSRLLPDMAKATISPRWKSLRKKKMIKPKRDLEHPDKPIIKRPGDSGRGQTVWVARPKSAWVTPNVE